MNRSVWLLISILGLTLRYTFPGLALLSCAGRPPPVAAPAARMPKPLDDGPPDFVLKAECDEGKAQSCTMLGRRYDAALEQACAGGAISACGAIVGATQGASVMANPTEVKGAYQRACGRGYEPGCAAAQALNQVDPLLGLCAGLTVKVRMTREGLSVQGADMLTHPERKGCEKGATSTDCQPDRTCAGAQGCLQPSAADWAALLETLRKVRTACPAIDSLTIVAAAEVSASSLRDATSRLAGGDAPLFHDLFVEGAAR